MHKEFMEPIYIVTVVYLHDTDIEHRKIYVGHDKATAKRAFMHYQELWDPEDEEEEFNNPFKEISLTETHPDFKDTPDEINGKQAHELLSKALDLAFEKGVDFSISPDDVGMDLDFCVSPCELEIYNEEFKTYGLD